MAPAARLSSLIAGPQASWRACSRRCGAWSETRTTVESGTDNSVALGLWRSSPGFLSAGAGVERPWGLVVQASCRRLWEPWAGGSGTLHGSRGSRDLLTAAGAWSTLRASAWSGSEGERTPMSEQDAGLGCAGDSAGDSAAASLPRCLAASLQLVTAGRLSHLTAAPRVWRDATGGPSAWLMASLTPALRWPARHPLSLRHGY